MLARRPSEELVKKPKGRRDNDSSKKTLSAVINNKWKKQLRELMRKCARKKKKSSGRPSSLKRRWKEVCNKQREKDRRSSFEWHRNVNKQREP